VSRLKSSQNFAHNCLNVTHCFEVSKCSATENCASLGYYAASNDNFLLTYRYNLKASSSRVKNPKATGKYMYHAL